MKAALLGIFGPGAGAHVTVGDGITASVGRYATCTLSIQDDRFLSGSHFEITASGKQLFLRDLGSSNGTFTNGVRIRECVLQDNDTIIAGESLFRIHFDISLPSTVAEVLTGQTEPLYAVLDAARDPAIYPLLLGSSAHYWCLYSGKSSLELEAVAPYLVHLELGCELMKKIIEDGWSNSWGIFLTSSQPIQTIWHELRRSLMVKLDHFEKFVFFRFYDPRVLRVFLPVAEPHQVVELAGTSTRFLLEDEDPTILLCFHSFSTSCKLDRLRVTPPIRPSAIELHQSRSSTEIIKTL